MPDLRNKSFELVENTDGYASGATIMRFDSATGPFRAAYSGPNVLYGQAIVSGSQMLYHALDSRGNLTAGRAEVSFFKSADEPTRMHLQWQWLTGDRSGGISIWRQIDA